MHSRTITIIGYSIISIAVISTVAIMVKVGVLKNFFRMYFLFWLLIPYFVMGYKLRWRFQRINRAIPECTIMLFVSVSGLFALVYAVYINPDPQGGFLLVPLPIYQLALYGFSRFVIAVLRP